MAGKLSQIEKYAIQGALHEKISPEEIAKTLKRSVSCINNYINGELNRIHETIANIEVAKTAPVEEKVVKVVPKGQAKKLMGMKTGNDKPGVAVMTPGASALGDDFHNAMQKNISRTARGNLYKADTGEKIE
jgi:hypothetical protein